MAKAEIKTRPTEVSVDAFLEAVADSGRREDAKLVRAMMERLSGEPARMWGPSIIGFGSYHYKYDSGHEGDMARIGFSPRARELVLYISGGFPRHQALMDRLGKYKTGKSCLYIKRLSDVDEDVLEQLVAESLVYMREKYPEGTGAEAGSSRLQLSEAKRDRRRTNRACILSRLWHATKVAGEMR